MGWETFSVKRGRGKILPPDTVSIMACGKMGVTSIADDLGSKIDVFLDKERCLIALVPNGSTLTVGHNLGAYSISFTGIAQQLGKVVDDMVGYYEVTREKIDDTGVIVIDLR